MRRRDSIVVRGCLQRHVDIIPTCPKLKKVMNQISSNHFCKHAFYVEMYVWMKTPNIMKSLCMSYKGER